MATDSTPTGDEVVGWTNWVGNQSFSCTRQLAPADESEIVEAVRQARASGGGIRCVAAGHSFGPIFQTSDTLINFSRMRGVGVEIFGELVAAEVADDVQYDPGNERVRS